MVQIIEDAFGSVKDPITGFDERVRRFTFSNDNGVSVQVITYGATVTAIRMPDKYGNIADIVLGYDDLEGYRSKSNPYFGATVGRVCNRIGFGQFNLNGKHFEVDKNLNGMHQLHGGTVGFDKFNWQAYQSNSKVVMTHVNPDGYQGYEGTVMAQVTYELHPDNTFSGKYTATVSKPTPINLTNHSYFNLAGHDKGHTEIYNHVVTLNADRYTLTDKDSIPTGQFQNVTGTNYDLRVGCNLGQYIAKLKNNGYDDNFCVTRGTDQSLTFAARVAHPKSGRVLEVYSDQPGVQFYTSNGMPDPNNQIYPEGKPHDDKPMSDANEPIFGKDGALYFKHGAFCLETQNYPDAVNHPNFPNSIVYPGEVYKHEFTYKLFCSS
ncbi:aldose 1-epimerase [Contarinia nasturtii]|uniref:aldose 1-epimerase n=1 Tax=Contarinia nasturtii TaxID=265458 RepID=UPI0012D4A951|nr:aldose 1-epimerase [Contarinia nasturtii]